jgi:hypothetical protein
MQDSNGVPLIALPPVRLTTTKRLASLTSITGGNDQGSSYSYRGSAGKLSPAYISSVFSPRLQRYYDEIEKVSQSRFETMLSTSSATIVRNSFCQSLLLLTVLRRCNRMSLAC